MLRYKLSRYFVILCAVQGSLFAMLMLSTQCTQAQSAALNIKPGGWQLSMTAIVNGSKRTREFKACLREDELKSAKPFIKHIDEGCLWSEDSRSATRLQSRASCNTTQMRATHELEINALDPESITIRHSAMKSFGGSHMLVKEELAGQWVGDSCQGFEEQGES